MSIAEDELGFGKGLFDFFTRSREAAFAGDLIDEAPKAELSEAEKALLIEQAKEAASESYGMK